MNKEFGSGPSREELGVNEGKAGEEKIKIDGEKSNREEIEKNKIKERLWEENNERRQQVEAFAQEWQNALGMSLEKFMEASEENVKFYSSPHEVFPQGTEVAYYRAKGALSHIKNLRSEIKSFEEIIDTKLSINVADGKELISVIPLYESLEVYTKKHFSHLADLENSKPPENLEPFKQLTKSRKL